jgi:hypothetical protein
MGASEALAAKLKQTINEEAEVLMAEKRTAAGAVNIKTNEERMKVGGRGRVDGWGRAEGRACCSCLAPRARQEPCPSWQRGGEGSARDGRAHRKGGACNSATTACRLPSISGSHHASPHAACACSQEVAAFWVPGKGPEAKALLDKPDMSTLCPASGDKLKLKDLVTVRFTRVPDGGPHEHMDPVTKDVFTNSSRLVVLKPTGDVVLKETWEKCIRPDGHYGGKDVGEGDVLELQRGGTGFAAHDKELQAKKRFLLGPGSGLADLRGQHSGPTSRFGLRFNN